MEGIGTVDAVLSHPISPKGHNLPAADLVARKFTKRLN